MAPSSNRSVPTVNSYFLQHQTRSLSRAVVHFKDHLLHYTKLSGNLVVIIAYKKNKYFSHNHNITLNDLLVLHVCGRHVVGFRTFAMEHLF